MTLFACRSMDNLHYEKFADGTVKCIEDEIPFEIPESWGWCRLGNISDNIQYGLSNSAEKVGTCRFLRITDIQNGGVDWDTVPFTNTNELDKYLLHINDILFARTGGTVGKSFLVSHLPFDSVFASYLIRVQLTNDISAQYIYWFFNSPTYWEQITCKTVGTGQPNCNGASLRNLLIPLPPLDEQYRILNKLADIRPLIEDYSVTYNRIQDVHKGFPDKIKQSVLQWAVQGKLVQQDENDEPASVLLERIRAEKEELIKQRKLKKDKHESIIFRRDNSYYERLDGVERCIDDEIPFEIPKSWEWVRLMEICTYIQRGKSPEYSPIKKYPVIAQKCIQWSGFSIESAKFIKPNSIQTYAKERLLEDNDLMWNSTGLGSLGRIGIYKSNLNPFELAVADSHVTVIRPFKRAILSKYLYYYFSNPSVQNVIEDSADGSTKQKELATTTIKTYLVPIPNLLEQHRIVNKVEDLLKLIKTL